MKKAIDSDTLGALVQTGSAREFRATRREPGWMLEARLGGYWLPVRSRREPIRIWLSLTAIGRFCETHGIRTLQVEF